MDARPGIAPAHHLLELQVNPGGIVLVAVGEINQSPAILSCQIHVLGQNDRHLLDILAVLVLNAVGSQGRPPEQNLLEGQVPLLHGFNAVQPLHIGGQIGKLLPTGDMGRLNDDIDIAFILQIGDGGQWTFDIEDLPRHLGVLPRIGRILPPLPPDPPDDVRGEGQADRNAGQRFLNLGPDIEDAGQSAFMAGAEHRQHHRLFLERSRLDPGPGKGHKQGDQQENRPGQNIF